MGRETLFDYCRRIGDDTLLQEWNAEKNSLTPADVARSSHQKAWWHCANGHEWQSVIKSRVEGSGCPYCTHRKVMQGETDLATTHPQISAQWHPTINGDLTPADVVAGSERRVWWKCDKGHEWQAPVYSRTRGLGCPICSGKKIVSGVNDLATLYPLIADQLDPNQNEKGLAARLSPYSPRSVYWLCERGHTYQMKVSAHVIWGRGCPYYAGRLVLPGYNDLATVAPLIAAQWHHELNGAATPETVTWGSNRKAWWICSSGHIWSARVSSRAGGSRSGCPICAGKSGIRSSLYMGIGKK